ncbi:hypothetical protein BJ165DRAFT_1461799 [Panaeolus papilionaceus]|nr:hypothetical protein BJ165DRAFT_1461799 [Panaeolus papilionaceus]
MTDDGLRCPSQDLDDEDSLFGSPPPSPSASSSTRAEREKSPALALPTSGSGASRFSTSTATGLQNVGTIALPGSHHDIELPMTPLALSLSHNVVSRPPALPGMQHKNSSGPISLGHGGTLQNAPPSMSASSSSATPSAPSTSRGSSLAAAGPKPRQKSKRTHQRSRSSNESTPQPRVEFDLPDPSGPLPAHFLRNQDKLLGVAGLVGGVRPAAITHVRGTSASNPIIVDDDEDAPKLGRRPVQTKELFLPTKIDPSLLEAPSNEEIVSVLIRQKDIFPVLQSILKLIAPQNTDPQRRPFFQTSNRNAFFFSSPSSSSSSSQPPLKKRKLNRVPAGAADWDVPYPFEQGEGPEEYRQTWERERSKQLITQLVKLIKTAAVKAATKKYVQKANKRQEQEEKAKKEAGFSYADPPPSTPMESSQSVTAGKAADSTSSFPSNLTTPSANVSDLPPCTSQTLPSVMTPNTSSAAFDHLISSLVAAQPHKVTVSNPPSESAGSSNLTPLAFQSQGPIDQSLFDSWMDILQAFPIQFDGGASEPSQISVDTPFGAGMNSHDLGLSGIDAFGLPISTPLSTSGSTTPFAEITPTIPSADELKAMVSTMGDLPATGAASAPDGSDTAATAGPSIDDHLIDPQLMMLSIPTLGPDAGTSTRPANQSDTGLSFTSSAMDVDRLSPLTSTAASSSGGTGPTTPASAAWDFAMPDFLNSLGTSGDGMMVDEGNGPSMGGLDAFGMGGVPHVVEGMDEGFLGKVDKGKGREVVAASSIGVVEDPATATRTAGTPTAPTTVQKPTPSLEDAVFQSFFKRTPVFTPTVPLPSSATLPALLSTLSAPTAASASSESAAERKLKREDILKRAKEKRQKLQEELNKVKTQLWETTVEQAGLVNLLKKLDEVEPKRTLNSEVTRRAEEIVVGASER